MADSAERQSDFDIKGLSLIDVSSEDDCLIDSPLCDSINPKPSEKGSGMKSVRFSMDPDNVEISLGSLGETANLEEQPNSLEQDKTRKNGKYNLRKSLAWDSAFFTSAGVLDAEELSSMMKGNEKGEMHTLPGIQEDVSKSCDSLTTLDSETLTLESLEADLFEDIRASIQKSNNASNITNASGKKELKTADTQMLSSLKKVELTTQDKFKQKAAPKKPNLGVKDSGKTLKQVSVRPQISQTVRPVAKSGESASSLHKPPKVLSRVGTISTTPTKRASLGSKNAKMEKDTKMTGKRTTLSQSPALGGLRNILPRPTLPSKSSSSSPASTKTELTASCSSLESCASASSGRSIKSSLNLIKQKNGSITNPSSSGRTLTNPSKIAPKAKNQPGSSKLSTFLKSSTKLASSISPSSSISEWSSASSSTSTVNQRSNVERASLGTGSHKRLGTNSDPRGVLDSHEDPTGQCSMGGGDEVTGSVDESINTVSAGTSGLLHPPSMKPSGLRMPSPKLGFFDGVRSSGRTPNGSMLSHPGVPSGLPKTGAKGNSPSGSSNKAKIGKIQPARTLTSIDSPKVDVKQTSSAVRSRSSLNVQKSPNAPTKVSSASRSSKSSPGISPKLQNKSSPKTGRESQGQNEKIVSPVLKKQVVAMGAKDGARMKDTKIVPIDGVSETTEDTTFEFEVKSPIPSKEATDAVFPYNNNDNKKEEANIEDQIAGLVKNNGAVEVHTNSDTLKDSILDSHLAHKYHKESSENENSLSKATHTSPSPVTSEILAGSRRPFSDKNSFYDMNTPVEVLPISESTLPENS